LHDLTDRFCAGAKPRDGEIQTDYFDTQVSGLALRVSEGRKSWTFHYTLNGKRRRLTFGAYPSISLSSARTHADEAKAAIAEGRDPSLAATETLQHVCELYMARDGANPRRRSVDGIGGQSGAWEDQALATTAEDAD
jgi:hypothetical protein